MSILKVDTINEKTTGNGVQIAGHVVQVVNGASSTDATYSSSSYTTIMQATITPKFISSKILIIYNFNSTWKNNTTAEGNWSIFRDSTNIAHVDGITPYNGTSTNNTAGSVAGTYLDSPSTSSAITYYGKLSITNGSVRLNTEGGLCAITLQEIAQ